MSKLIKISKVCKEMGICRQTIYNWYKSDKIKLVKSPGGQWFMSQETYNFISQNNTAESE